MLEVLKLGLLKLDPFCTWLAATPVSQFIQTTDWLIPAVQTVHIIAVAAVMTAVLLMDLTLLRVRSRVDAGARAGGRDTVAAAARRLLPLIWWPLPILLLTGATLIVAEPARALENPVFSLKMALLLAAALVTLTCQIPLRTDAEFWEFTAGRRRAARSIALVSLPLWIGILFAGRWIAYVQAG
jgi:uncharacterized membrane protein